MLGGVILTLVGLVFVEKATAQCVGNPQVMVPDPPDDFYPVDGNPDNAYCFPITFDPAVTGFPTGVQMDLWSTWQGDLGIWIEAEALQAILPPGRGKAPRSERTEVI